MSVTEAKQMVLFDEYTYETRRWPESQEDWESRSAWGIALAVALILISWAPIALLIWMLT